MTETKTDPSRRALVGGLSAGMVAALGSAAGAQEQVAQTDTSPNPPRSYPRPPFERQQQDWPGLASRMVPRPDHGETTYKGSGRLAGRKALITGGDSGIGRAAAIAYAREGADVAINYLPAEESDAAEVVALIGQAGRKAVALPGDIRDEAFCQRLVADAARSLGGLDILVNNAGITRDNLVLRMKDDEWDAVIAVNLSAAFRLSRAAVKGMMKRRHGRIVNIGSVVGATGNPGQVNYAAAKAGLVGMTKALAAEVATRNLTVNCIAPGFITSPMTDALNDKQRDGILTRVPMGRLGTGTDIAAAAIYLASDEAAYVTGQTLHVNGGMAMY